MAVEDREGHVGEPGTVAQRAGEGVGHGPGIVAYTTADWWNTCTGGSNNFPGNPLWIAANGTADPPMPAGWGAWTFWQYTSTGTVPGIPTQGGTDVSHFVGNIAALAQ